jgi:hypothetical protein
MVRGLVVLAAWCGLSCNVEVGIDRTTWACVRDVDCGTSARCVAGACVPEPTATVCQTRTGSGVAIRFEAGGDGNGRRLDVTANGRTKTFALPARVVGVEAGDGPVVGCCENDCCAVSR